MDQSRLNGLFSSARVNDDIHIIGVGATGSFVAMELARIGCPVLNIYDFDDIELHNIPNQYYNTTHIGKLKVEALKEELEKINPDIVVNVSTNKVEANDVAQMSGYIFLLVDSMKARKELWEVIKLNDKIKNVWESRLGSDQARVYSLPISKEIDYSKYEQDFYSDDTAEVSACGTSITVLPVVLQTASLIVVQFMDLIMDRGEAPFKIIFDNHYNKYEEQLQVEEEQQQLNIEDIF